MTCVIALRMRRTCLGTKVSSCGHGLLMLEPPVVGRVRQRNHFHSVASRWHDSLRDRLLRPAVVASFSPQDRPSRRCLSTPSASRVRQQSLDRDVVVSVLEASATRRDAKSYLQKYAPKTRSSTSPAEIPGDARRTQTRLGTAEPANIAIMSLKAPQKLDTKTLDGIAKTLTQLRVLGLLSVVVFHCGADENGAVFQDQALRLCEAIDLFGKPGVKLAPSIFTKRVQEGENLPLDHQQDLKVEDQGLLQRALENDMIVVVPSLASLGTTFAPRPTDAHNAIIALTEYLSGKQPLEKGESTSPWNEANRPHKIASIERVIIIDALGATPVPGRPGVCQRFVNLEQEYDTLLEHFQGLPLPSSDRDWKTGQSLKTHADNLKLAKETLWRLPSTSSALITTPFAAANLTSDATAPTLLATNDTRFEFNGMVTTRKKQNPLLHNLLTDKPVFSSSLPIQRIQAGSGNFSHARESIDATLVKRGMPLAIYPDPWSTPWTPPKPGAPRLRLTDSCIDLPRLVNLIEDSFGRKLDVEAYLRRVQESLAGVIIAGEYEGGAILTWERPDGIDDAQAFAEKRFIPYLDKFAVLKSRQGSGGVADMVFNAMVRDCFPRGVCWRSRKNNPVNKWYFERSTGISKLSDSNWAMFWTTPGLDGKHQALRDYESVCRGIAPSWADNHHVLD